MAQYGALEVEVKVYESKMKPAVTGKGGVYQVIGNCHATISLAADEDKPLSGEEMVLFPDFSGRISRFYNTVEDFEAGKDPRVIIDYSNSYKNDNTGQYVDQTKPSNEFQAILEVETMMTFKNGFTKSERDENNAAAAGMEMSDYTKLMNDTLAAAGAIGGDLETQEEKVDSEKSASQQLDQQIG